MPPELAEVTSAAEQLAALLREAKVTPTLRSECVTPSAIYDPTYRIAIIALTLRTCGRPKSGAGLSLASAKLKLFQFVAVHPHLLPSLRGWVDAYDKGERPSLDGWARFPRGYASDSLCEKLVEYLLASGHLRRVGSNVVDAAESTPFVTQLLAKLDENDLFEDERRVLMELAQMRITLEMLRA